MTTRREFLAHSAAAAVGLTALRFIPGCENIEVDRKIQGFSFDFITEPEDWYRQSGNGNTLDEEKALDVSRDNWELQVTGPDGEIGSVDFDELNSMETITYIKTMKCVYFTSLVGAVADTLISTGIFKGVPLPTLFDEIGGVPADSTAKVRTFGADGFTSNLTVDRATREGPDPLPPMLAYEMNGRRLPKLRGGPVRLVIPEMWGYKNMKWVEKLEFTENEEPFGGYEQDLFDGADRIDDPGRIALSTLGSSPVGGAEIEGPDITVQGVSVVGGSAIEDVEIKLDDRDWESAEIKSADEIQASVTDPVYSALQAARNFRVDDWPQKNVWVVWTKQFEGLSTGSHKIVLRSSDSEGNVNPPAEEVENMVAPKVSQQRVEIEFQVT